MHAVHVITRLIEAGSEENTVATCLYQARCGWRVTLVHGRDHCPDWYRRIGDEIELVQLDTLVHPIQPLRDIAALIALCKLFRATRPSVVHTHQSKAGIIGRLAAAIARVPAVVHSIHIAPFVNVGGFRRRFYLVAEKLCARVTDLFIPVSIGMRDAYLEEGIGHPDMYDVIYSGMPLARFTSCAAPANWRERIGGWAGKGRPKIVVMLAAFEPRKRQREFLHAVAPRLCARPDICLILAGEGSQRQQCERDARQLGIACQVRFPGHDRAPQELIALADLCLLTSRREGLPRAVVQYIAGGKPVLLCPLPGIEELVRGDENGVICGAGDMDATVAEMFSLLDDDHRLSVLTAGACATDVSRWSEATMGQRIEAAYQRLLRRKPAELF